MTLRRSAGLLSCITNPPSSPFSLFLKPTSSPKRSSFPIMPLTLLTRLPSPFYRQTPPSLPFHPLLCDSLHSFKHVLAPPSLTHQSCPLHPLAPPPPPLPVILLKPRVSISVSSHSGAPHINADSRCVSLGAGGRRGQQQHLSCTARGGEEGRRLGVGG